MGFLLLLTASAAVAQSAQAGTAQESWPLSRQLSADLLEQAAMGDKARALAKIKPGPQGRWWSNPQTAGMLGVTNDQVKKMDDIFQQHRLRLIDLNASLAKEETILEPLVGADQPDDAKVLPQIDRVAQARAELEKANARMLWAIRRVLTPEQWKKLQAESPKPRPWKY